MGDVVVEALDRGQLVQGHIGDLFQPGEALGDQQMGDHLVHVKRVHEQLTAAVLWEKIYNAIPSASRTIGATTSLMM